MQRNLTAVNRMDLEVSDELSKKPKKDKKSKKHKKVKKSKKLKKKIREVSSSSSLSDSEDSGNEWVEKGPTRQVSKDESESKKDTASFNAPQRDEWMTAPCMFACVSREQLRAVKQPTDSKKKEEAAKYMLDRPGQSSRELNPYWADNGTGLPSVRPTAHESLSLNANTVGDQGVGWLRRALKRAKEQAEESGRSLEEVAAERWGSLQKLEDLLSEAEGRKVSLREGKPNNSGYELQKYRKNDKFGSRFRSGHEGGGKDSKYERKQDRLYDRDYTQNRGNDKYAKKDLNYGSLTPKHGDNDGFRDSRKMASFERPGDAKSYQASSSATQAPCSDKHKKDAFYGYSPSSSGGKARLGFQKPGESYDKCATEERYSSTSRRHKSWQKEDKRLQQHDEKTKLSSLSVSKRDSKSPSGLSNSEIELEKIQVKTKEEPESGILSDQQLNELAAKLVKAEILGNNELIEKLQRKLDAAREARSSNPKVVPTVSRTNKSDAEVVILSRTDSKGFTRPLQTHSAHPEPIGGRRKKQNVDTHGVDGQRVRYFPDDDKYTLQEMFQREKLTTVEDQNEMFAKLAGKDGRQEHDYDMDDIFSEKARQKESDGKVEARERGRAIQEHKRKERVLDSCKWCFDGKELQRHLIISAGSRAFLCLPPYQSLTEGHCLIIPLHHTTCSTQLDEDVWEEMQDFRKALVRMFSADDEDCVFFESAMYLNKFPHMILHCVPLSREIGDMAPIYFKKAILECETEWSTNKKLVDLSKRNIRHSVPKGLPYFSVDFGNEGGFAHVIEEEKSFPINFAQEIIGGMLDLDHNVWRKPRMENFDKQRSKVIDFSKKWQSYDFTKEFPKVKRLRTEEPDPFESS